MAIRSFMFSLMLVVGGIVVLGNLEGITAQTECGGDLGSILDKCYPFIRKDGPEIPPSQECCDVLKNVDIPCLCKQVIPPEISLKKAIYVARTCGCSVPTKCGSYSVPPPESSPVPEE